MSSPKVPRVQASAHPPHSAFAWITPKERVEALQLAAKSLELRWPRLQCGITVRVGPNILPAHAVYAWPGLVRVNARWTGELLAQSMPGRPFDIDPVHTPGMGYVGRTVRT